METHFRESIKIAERRTHPPLLKLPLRHPPHIPHIFSGRVQLLPKLLNLFRIKRTFSFSLPGARVSHDFLFPLSHNSPFYVAVLFAYYHCGWNPVDCVGDGNKCCGGRLRICTSVFHFFQFIHRVVVWASLSSGLLDSQNKELHRLNNNEERRLLTEVIKLIPDVSTQHSIFSYNLRGFIDPRVGVPVDGMIYSNNALYNCSVKMLQFSQSISAAAEQQVSRSIRKWSDT